MCIALYFFSVLLFVYFFENTALSGRLIWESPPTTPIPDPSASFYQKKRKVFFCFSVPAQGGTFTPLLPRCVTFFPFLLVALFVRLFSLSQEGPVVVSFASAPPAH